MGRRTAACAALAFTVALAVLAVGTRAAQGATGLVDSIRSTTTTEAAETVTAAVEGTADGAAGSTTATAAPDETDDGVGRVVVVGDSLVVGAEDELDELFAANGVEVTYLAVSGTGLLTDQGVRLTELEAALDELHPGVVVIESCCNYDGDYRLFDGTIVPADSDLLWETWADQTERMVEAAEAHDAEVHLVVTPRLVGDSPSAVVAERIERFDQIYRDLGVALVDWDAALYPDGTTTGLDHLRAADGLHLTDAGDELVAAATWAAIAGSFS